MVCVFGSPVAVVAPGRLSAPSAVSVGKYVRGTPPVDALPSGAAVVCADGAGEGVPPQARPSNPSKERSLGAPGALMATIVPF